MYLNPTYLNRVFKKNYGVGMGQYIIAERMKLAGKLLESGKFSATTVALQLGYQSYSNFSLMFRRHYGCTPKEYLSQRNN